MPEESNYNPLVEDTDINNIKKDGSVAFIGTGDGFKDEDDMVSDSPNAAASQQSIKKYVDDNTFSLLDEDDMASDSATAAASQQSIKYYVDNKEIEVEKVVKSFTAGEAIADGNAVFVADGTETITAGTQFLGGDSDAAFGRSGANTQRLGQSFQSTTAFVMDKITIYLKKANDPADNVSITIEADAAGAPSGTPLATAIKAGDDVTTSQVAYELTLDAEVTIAANTTYWIVFARSGALDDTNYYFSLKLAGDTYTAGDGYAYTSGGWADGTMDVYFDFNVPVTAGRVYRTKADDTDFLDFIGVASGTAARGVAIDVVTNGTNTRGGWGLTPKSAYYLSDTAGAIATTAGTNALRIGKALTATELLIQKEYLIPASNVASGSLSNMDRNDSESATTETQAITGLGFTPTKVTIYVDSTAVNGATSDNVAKGELTKTASIHQGIGISNFDKTANITGANLSGSLTSMVAACTGAFSVIGTLTIDSLDADGFTVKVVWTGNYGGAGSRVVTFTDMKYIATK